MINLVLTRHSYAENGYSINDYDRKLTSDGKCVAKNQANLLKSLNIPPTKIISSPAIRAKETAEIYRNVINSNICIEYVNFLYESYTTQEFISLINTIGGSNETILVIAHNPTLSNIAFRLSSQLDNAFLPCSMAILKYDISWFELEPENAVNANFYSSYKYMNKKCIKY